MRRRLTVPAILAFVSIMHGLLLWQQWNHSVVPLSPRERDSVMQAFQVAAAPAPAPPPQIKPAPPRPQPVAQPRPIRPAPSPVAAAEPLPMSPPTQPVVPNVTLRPAAPPAAHGAITAAVITSTDAMPADATDHNIPISAAMTTGGPALQLHDAQGQPLALVLPDDGSALPAQGLLHFKVHGFLKEMEYHAHAELEWQTQGQSYEARQRISAFLLGSMEQHSQGQITSQGLQPAQFVDQRLTRRRSVQFDWAAQQARFDPAREPAAIGTGAQDRLSVFLQLASLLHTRPEVRTPGTRIEIPTLGSRSLQIWTFVVEEDELLTVPAGDIGTLRLQRLPRSGEREQARLWVSPERGYLPVRIRMEEANGDVMELSLKF